MKLKSAAIFTGIYIIRYDIFGKCPFVTLMLSVLLVESQLLVNIYRYQTLPYSANLILSLARSG